MNRVSATKKSIINSFLLVLLAANSCQAETFLCPTLKPDHLYYYFDWIDKNGVKNSGGNWNKEYWRLWINGDSYLTPKFEPVGTSPLGAHYFASTNTWYLKCTSADLNVGPRNNVWPYENCAINKANTGFDCQ